MPLRLPGRTEAIYVCPFGGRNLNQWLRRSDADAERRSGSRQERNRTLWRTMIVVKELWKESQSQVSKHWGRIFDKHQKERRRRGNQCWMPKHWRQAINITNHLEPRSLTTWRFLECVLTSRSTIKSGNRRGTMLFTWSHPQALEIGEAGHSSVVVLSRCIRSI